MGLIELINGWRYGEDFTRDWIRSPELQFEYDLDKFQLNGIRLNDPRESLRDLGIGRAESRPSIAYGYLQYFSLGLTFDVDLAEQSIGGMMLIWDEPDLSQFQPFAGTCWMNGQRLTLGGEMKMNELIQLFGDAHKYEQDEDDGEVLLTYEFGEITLEADFGDDGLLDDMNIYL